MSLWIIFGTYVVSNAIVHAFKRDHEWEKFVIKVPAAGSALFLSWWFPLYWQWLQGLLK
jgi:hypothetical protein